MARRHNAVERKFAIPDNPDGNSSAVGSSTEPNDEARQSNDEAGSVGKETGSNANGLDAATEGTSDAKGANPEIAAGNASGEKARKERSDKGQKRGPRGTGSNTGTRSNAKLGIDKGLLASQIFGLHQIAATVTGQPILMLQPSEATALADRVTDLVGHYGFQPQGPIMLWIGLAATAGAIYLPRVLSIRAMKSSSKTGPEMNPGTDIPKAVLDFGETMQ